MERHEKRTEPSVTGAMLHAYLDGELDPQGYERVQAMLDANPSLAAILQEYAAQNRSLHELYDHHLDDELPTEIRHLTRRLEQGMPETGRDRVLVRVAAVAAGLVIFVLVSLLSYQQAMIRQSQEKLFVMFQDSVAAETPETETPKVKQAVTSRPVAVNESSSTEDRARSAPPVAKRVPDLSKFGFRLVGTRLLLVSSNPAMQLIYQNEVGSQISLYFSPTKSENQGLTLMQQGPLALLYWSDSGRLYTMLGEVDRKTLLDMGRVVNSNWTLVLDSPRSNDAETPAVIPNVQDEQPGKPQTQKENSENEARKMNFKPIPGEVPGNGDGGTPSKRSQGAKDGSV
jgi:anti-sigma factor RsiW